MIVVVSDVHLAERAGDSKVKTDDKNFIQFLDHIAEDRLKDGGDLVLLGDIVDFWRRDFVSALRESDTVVEKLIAIGSKAEIHYIAGNHDFHMLRMYELSQNKFPFKVEKSLRLRDDKIKLLFLHGYQLEVLANPYCKSMTAYETFSEGLCLAGDDTGNAADRLWELFKSTKSALDGIKRLPSDIKGFINYMVCPPPDRNAQSAVERLASSQARTIYLGMEPDEFLIFGHTHSPFCDTKNRVANTGSWGKEPCDHYSFIEIEDGVVRQKRFS